MDVPNFQKRSKKDTKRSETHLKKIRTKNYPKKHPKTSKNIRKTSEKHPQNIKNIPKISEKHPKNIGKTSKKELSILLGCLYPFLYYIQQIATYLCILLLFISQFVWIRNISTSRDSTYKLHMLIVNDVIILFLFFLLFLLFYFYHAGRFCIL